MYTIVNRVSITTDPDARYPEKPPFHPGEQYPEYPFGNQIADTPNPVYTLVRNTLHQQFPEAGDPSSNDWNPLGSILSPGQAVLVKPNLVLHAHPRGHDIRCLITHGSVVRALLDYIAIALQGEGRVVLGDSPLQGTNFQAALQVSGMGSVVAWYHENTNLDVSIRDFRQVHAVIDSSNHVAGWKEVPGDPAGYTSFDLGNESALSVMESQAHRFRVSNYQSEDTLMYHHTGSHQYVITNSVLDADVVFSVPKMKTHCKVGATLGMKNFVGIVGRKQCLAHHRKGGPAEGGDEYPDDSRLKGLSVALEECIDRNRNPFTRGLLKLGYRINERLIKTMGLEPTRDGGWHGNDTAWRMVHDLVRIVRYGTREGAFAPEPQRAVYTLVDGVIAGEGEGPLEALPKPVGAIIAGDDPVATDLVTTAFMGFDYERIPLFANALSTEPQQILIADLDDLEVCVDSERMGYQAYKSLPLFHSFRAPNGWLSAIELDVAVHKEAHTD